ncbi:MAG: ABC transporter substrate-binding protein [Pseudomonadales bacterium]|nr:ABC transporter substrate-binding protein [Pseudomonadales bacterium]
MRIIFLVSFLILLLGCAKEPEKVVKIAMNPWPGYELLYLAEQKGFFKEVGANIKLVQVSSLSDSQRAYVAGRVDGMASTLIEAVQVNDFGSRPLKVVLVSDYSNGADMIIANVGITTVKQLKGKNVGAEINTLGSFILQRALENSGLSLDDVNLINIEQFDGKKALTDGVIDAFVTYPPVSIDLLKNPANTTLFTSAEIPYEVIDVVSISDTALADNPQLYQQLQQAWQMAIDYMAKHPDEAHSIMAEREGITPVEFSEALSEVVILNAAQQKDLFRAEGKLAESANAICRTLVHVGSLKTDCAQLPALIYQP